MTSLRTMIIGAAALAAGGASAMPALAADPAGPPARLSVAVYNPSAPPTLTRADFPFGCWYADGWHGPGYYWCGYQPESYYSYGYYGYRPEGYYSYHPARYSYWHRGHRVRHAARRVRRRLRA